MIYPDATVEEWCEKHKIDPMKACLTCKAPIPSQRPWLSKKYAGLNGKCPKCKSQNSTSVHRDQAEGLRMREEIFGW